MVSLTTIERMESPALHILRSTRGDDRILEECELSKEDLSNLATQGLGLFAGGYTTIEMLERRLTILAKSAAACRWTVVVSSKQLFHDTKHRLCFQISELGSCVSEHCAGFKVDNLKFTTVEQLSMFNDESLDGVILYDPACHIHRARNFTRFDGNNHDRAQLIANFISNQRARGAIAALCLMTLKPPAAVGTAMVAEAYMQEGWWFVTPNSLRFTDA